MDANLHFGNFDLGHTFEEVELQSEDDEFLLNAINSMESDKNNAAESRYPTLSEEDINALVESRQSSGTKKMTDWSVRQFKNWLGMRNLQADFEMLPVDTLDSYLRRFYAEVRTTEGKMYSRSSYSGIRAAINRHLRSPPFNRNISLTDKEFYKSSQVFHATLKKLSVEGLDTTTHHQPISEGDLTKLRTCDNYNSLKPHSLQRKVWFEITLAFARRGCENLQSLKKDAYAFKFDDTGREYVEMTYNEKLKNHQGLENTKNMDSKPRMYGSITNSLSCPVKALKLYLSKLNPDSDRLFQQPKQHFCFESPVWYTTRPVGSKTIGTFMATLSAEANLSRRYTNHCVRATTVTRLSHAGVTNRAIARITKHRNEKSLEHYENDSSDAQKRLFSEILLQENSESHANNACTETSTVNVSLPGPIESSSCVNVSHAPMEVIQSPLSITSVSISSNGTQPQGIVPPLLPLCSGVNSSSVTNVLNQKQMPQYMNPFSFSGCSVSIENHFHYH